MEATEKARLYETRAVQICQSYWTALIAINGIIISGLSITLAINKTLKYYRVAVICSLVSILLLLATFVISREIPRSIAIYFRYWHPLKHTNRDWERKAKNKEQTKQNSCRQKILIITEACALWLTAISIVILLWNAI